MEDLYEILGVPRDATLSQIKAAHRRMARKLHPDLTQGDADAMAVVNVAYKTLKDPKKRAHYDKTGQIDDPSSEDRVKTMFIQALNSVMGQEGNILTLMRTELQKAIDEGIKVIKQAKRGLKINEDRLELVIGPIEGNLIAETIGAAVKRDRENIEKAEGMLAHVRAALAMLDDYQSDEAPPKQDLEDEEDFLKALLGSVTGFERRGERHARF